MRTPPTQTTSLLHDHGFNDRILERFVSHQGFDLVTDRDGILHTRLIVSAPTSVTSGLVVDRLQVFYVVGQDVYGTRVRSLGPNQDGRRALVLRPFVRVRPQIIPSMQFSVGVHLNLITAWRWLPPVSHQFTPPSRLTDLQTG